MRKRKGKIHFIKKVCLVKSKKKKKKHESALERIRGYQGEIQIHPRKMKVCQKQKKKKKKKKKKKLAKLKTRKDDLGKN